MTTSNYAIGTIPFVAKQRDVTFDIMKGIGILLMFVGHFQNVGWLHQIIYSYHMPMFFLIAGYFSKSIGAMKSANGAEGGGRIVFSPIFKYFQRLVVPAFVVYALLIVYLIPWAVVKQDWSNVMAGLIRMIWLSGDEPLITQYGEIYVGIIWFLPALFWAKSIHYLLTGLNKWGMLGIACVLSFGAVIANSYMPYLPWCLYQGLIALPFVAIGWWVKQEGLNKWFVIVSIIAWIIAILFSDMEMYTCDMKCWPIDVLGGCGGAICLYYVSKWIGIHAKWITTVLAQIGICSLAVICMHEFFDWSDIANTICIHTPLKALKANMDMFALYKDVMILIAGICIAKAPGLKRIFG